MSVVFFFLFGAVVFTEALTELIVKSQIFSPARVWLSFQSSFLKELLSCGYCTSVWVALSFTLVSGMVLPFTGTEILNALVTALVIHRLSNYLHNFNDCWLDKYYNLQRVNSIKEDNA